MFEYGALFGSTLAEDIRDGIQTILRFLQDIPFYWYIIAIVAIFCLGRLLTKKRVT